MSASAWGADGEPPWAPWPSYVCISAWTATADELAEILERGARWAQQQGGWYEKTGASLLALAERLRSGDEVPVEGYFMHSLEGAPWSLAVDVASIYGVRLL